MWAAVIRPTPLHDGMFIVVFGHHRHAAVESLGIDEIRCEIVNLEDLAAEIAEIDENLVRGRMSKREEDKALARRKVLYEQLHPETVRGVAGALARWGGRKCN